MVAHILICRFMEGGRMTELLGVFPCLALGAIVGFFAGLLGIGGGGIMVPVLTMLFVSRGFPIEHTVHMALGTSMAAIVLTSVSSLQAHHQHGAVLWPVVRAMAPGILLGTFGAVFIVSHVSTWFLAILFACFMGVISIIMLLNIKPTPSRKLPGAVGFSAAGIGIGAVSALIAIGGGSLTVPFLTWCNVKIPHAIGTSAAVGLPIAVSGTLGYMISGWEVAGVPPYTLGFVYLPAVLLISTVSYATAPLGARLAHHLPIPVLKRIFAMLLVLLSLKMLYTVFSA